MELGAEAQSMGESRYAAATVAAHRAEASVAVVVFHLEGRAFEGGGFEGHEAVGPDAETAVAQSGNLLGGEVVETLAVVDDNEVVAGSVELVERYLHQMSIMGNSLRRSARWGLTCSMALYFSSAV